MMETVVTFKGGGLDQLKQQVGTPQVGDTALLHCRGFYTAERPSLLPGFRKKESKVEFLSTHRIGSTAFIRVPITKSTSKEAHELEEHLAAIAFTMALGDSVRVTLPAGSFPTNNKNFVKGQYASIADDAQSLILEVDSFRIERDGKEHHRVNRNGHDTMGIAGGGF